MKFYKLIFFLSIFFLNACAQSTVFLGPAVTVASGNAFNAGMQVVTNTALKNGTGKDAVTHIKDAIEEDKRKKKFNSDFRKIVENRVKLTRKKLTIN